MHFQQRPHLAFELVEFVHLNAELVVGVDVGGHVEVHELHFPVWAQHDIRNLRITMGRFQVQAGR
ncbi:hypothetical protein D3C87_1871440 [compost metagenome]